MGVGLALGALQAYGSYKAGKQKARGEANAQIAAGQQLALSGERYQDVRDQLTEFQGTIGGMFAPYRRIGLESLDDYQRLLGTGPDSIYANVENTPGYQFRLEQGAQTVERSAAARGMQLSGGTLKDLTRFSQGLASQEFQNAFARREGTLRNLIALGTNARDTEAGLRLQTIGNFGTLAQMQGNEAAIFSGAQQKAMRGQAEARAAGTLGVGNAFTAGYGLQNTANLYDRYNPTNSTSLWNRTGNK